MNKKIEEIRELMEKEESKPRTSIIKGETKYSLIDYFDRVEVDKVKGTVTERKIVRNSEGIDGGMVKVEELTDTERETTGIEVELHKPYELEKYIYDLEVSKEELEDNNEKTKEQLKGVGQELKKDIVEKKIIEKILSTDNTTWDKIPNNTGIVSLLEVNIIREGKGRKNVKENSVILISEEMYEDLLRTPEYDLWTVFGGIKENLKTGKSTLLGVEIEVIPREKELVLEKEGRLEKYYKYIVLVEKDDIEYIDKGDIDKEWVYDERTYSEKLRYTYWFDVKISSLSGKAYIKEEIE